MTIFMILLDDLMSVFMGITYDSNGPPQCSESLGLGLGLGLGFGFGLDLSPVQDFDV
jgi:hypothetical protein